MSSINTMQGADKMKRLKILGLALVAAFALSALAVASASATVAVILGGPTTFTGKAGKAVLSTVGGASLTATEVHVTGSIPVNDARLGTYSFDFLKVTSSFGGECTSLLANGTLDTKGLVLLEGECHVAHLTANHNHWELVFLFSTLHIVCEKTLVGTILIEVRTRNGNGIVCLVSSGDALTHTLTVKATKGVQEIKEYEYNEGENRTNVGLESSTNGGAFEEAGENAEGAEFTTGTLTEAMG
jgi:hypothetical protein